jgi:hypothetical protein
LVFCFDETWNKNKQDLPPTLQRMSAGGVNAWVCHGVVCSPSLSDLQTLLKHLDL